VKGQRLVDAAFFSLVMLTTLGCAFSTATAIGVRRLLSLARAGRQLGPLTSTSASASPGNTTLQQGPRSPCVTGNGTVVIPTLELIGS
jgi:hypothetical protein